MILNADDKGYCDKAAELVQTFQESEDNYDNKGLCDYKYQDALKEIVDKGLVLEFENKHGNKVYLIRHWFFHQRFKSGLTTNYYSLEKNITLLDNEYALGKKESDNKEKKNKVKYSKVNYSKVGKSKVKQIEKPLEQKTEDDDLSLPF